MKKEKEDFLYSSQSDLGKNILYSDIKSRINITNSKKNKKSFVLKKYLPLGFIILILTLVCIFGVNRLKVSAEELKEAVAFFEENNLVIEGLTNDEIRKVYKDITTNSFKYEKTGEVIIENIKEVVPGYEIDKEDIDSDYILSYWEFWKQLHSGDNEVKGEIIYEDVMIWNDNYEFQKTVFSKYEGEKLLWKVELNISFVNYIIFDDYILLYGSGILYNKNEVEYFEVIKIDLDGNLIWKTTIEDTEDIGKIIYDKDDNTYNIFSESKSSKCLTYNKLNSNGSIILKKEYDLKIVNIIQITEVNNEYLLYLNVDYNNRQFLKIDKEGNLLNGFYYYDDSYEYAFASMISYNGKLYLSGFSYPKNNNDHIYGREEIRYILDEIFNKCNGENYQDVITDEYVLSLLRANYKAVLFVCDENSGKLDEFYTVDGALGASLNIDNDNNLVWNVEYFISGMFSPATSSFTLGGVTKVYEYIYNNSNDDILALLEVKETELLNSYRR